jgi:hypothetical protein
MFNRQIFSLPNKIETTLRVLQKQYVWQFSYSAGQ